MPKKKPIETHIVRVVMQAPISAAELVIYAQLVHDKMTENVAVFPTPDPPMIDLQSLVGELRNTAAGAKIKGIGGAGDRNAVHKRLMEALKSERAYVEKVAAADPKNASVIAALAAMRLQTPRTFYKPTLALKHGPVSGSVLALAKAIAGATAYYWRYSLDAGETWIDMPMTTGAKTKLEHLTPKATVHVQFRAHLRKTGPANWCDPVWIIVV